MASVIPLASRIGIVNVTPGGKGIGEREKTAYLRFSALVVRNALLAVDVSNAAADAASRTMRAAARQEASSSWRYTKRFLTPPRALSTAPLFLRAFPEMPDGHETCATVSYPPVSFCRAITGTHRPRCGSRRECKSHV